MFWYSSRNIRPAQSLERGWWVSLHTLQHIKTSFFYQWHVDKTRTSTNVSVPIILFVKMSSVKMVCVQIIRVWTPVAENSGEKLCWILFACCWMYAQIIQVQVLMHRNAKIHGWRCVSCTGVTTALVYSVTISVRSHISPRRSLWTLPSLLLWWHHHLVRSWTWPLQHFLLCHALVSFELSKK